MIWMGNPPASWVTTGPPSMGTRARRPPERRVTRRVAWMCIPAMEEGVVVAEALRSKGAQAL